MLLDGKKVSEEYKKVLQTRVSKMKEKNITPCLAIINLGHDDASNVYVKHKRKYADEIGVEAREYGHDIENEIELVELILNLNADNNVHGILLQLPLPKGYNTDTIINMIDPSKDVDGFTDVNLGRLMNNDPTAIHSATPQGIMMLLDHYQIDVTDKKCVVIGRGKTVGKPLAQMLINNDANVTVIHSKTSQSDANFELKYSDIVFSCVGKYNLINVNIIEYPKDIVFIDAGITRDPNGKLCGDINFKDKENLTYTPVPGGVGPMTICALFFNLLDICNVKGEI